MNRRTFLTKIPIAVVLPLVSSMNLQEAKRGRAIRIVCIGHIGEFVALKLFKSRQIASEMITIARDISDVFPFVNTTDIREVVLVSRIDDIRLSQTLSLFRDPRIRFILSGYFTYPYGMVGQVKHTRPGDLNLKRIKTMFREFRVVSYPYWPAHPERLMDHDEIEDLVNREIDEIVRLILNRFADRTSTSVCG